jgi:hypothetical protein
MTRSGGRLVCVCLRSYKILNHRNERTAIGFFDVRQPLDLLAGSDQPRHNGCDPDYL